MKGTQYQCDLSLLMLTLITWLKCCSWVSPLGGFSCSLFPHCARWKKSLFEVLTERMECYSPSLWAGLSLCRDALSMLCIFVVHEPVRDVGRQSWRFPLCFFSFWDFSCCSLLKGKFLQVQDFASLYQKDSFCHQSTCNPSCHPDCTWLWTKSCESEPACLCFCWHVLSTRVSLLFTLQCLQVHILSAGNWSYMFLSHYKKQKCWPVSNTVIVRMKRLKEVSDQKELKIEFSLVQFVQSGPTLCDPMDCSTPGLPVHHELLDLLKLIMSVELVMPSNHLIFCCPLLSPSIFPRVRVFSNESALCIRSQKYCNFSFTISPPNEYSGLISFTID